MLTLFSEYYTCMVLLKQGSGEKNKVGGGQLGSGKYSCSTWNFKTTKCKRESHQNTTTWSLDLTLDTKK